MRIWNSSDYSFVRQTKWTVTCKREYIDGNGNSHKGTVTRNIKNRGNK